MIIQCCYCWKIKQPDDSWKAALALDAKASHTYCPECFLKAKQELRQLNTGKP